MAMLIKYYVVIERTKSGNESVIKITPDKEEAKDYFEVVDRARGSKENKNIIPLVKSKFQIVTLEKKVYWNTRQNGNKQRTIRKDNKRI